MYAVIKHSGRQYLVKQGDIVLLDKINNAQKETELEIKDVLLINDSTNTIVGKPTIANASIRVKVLGEKKGEKVIIFKHKRRKNYRKKQGFRPIYTAVKIEEIIYKNN